MPDGIYRRLHQDDPEAKESVFPVEKGYPMSEIAPVSTASLHQQEIAHLNARITELTAENARQARQITEQALHVGWLDRTIANLTAENAGLRERLPKPAERRFLIWKGEG